MDALVRDRDGRGYRIMESPLGVGGTASVYLAMPENPLDQPGGYRALKLLSEVSQPEDRDRFIRCAEFLLGVDHPGLVRVHGVSAVDGDDQEKAGFARGRPFLVMDLLPGGNLVQWTAQQGGRLDARQACKIVRTVLSAVGALHTRGVVHRDVKPANILLDASSNPRLADLGSARLPDSPSGPTVHGTPAYFAPEQACDPAGVDARADLYGVGATLARLLTGHDPWFLFHDARQMELLADVNPALRTLIGRACAWSPGDRYADASSLGAALDEVLGGLPLEPEGGPTTPAAPTAPPAASTWPGGD